MSTPKNTNLPNRGDTKTALSAIRLTTSLGAVSLTLAGWGLLARVDAVNASHTAADAAAPNLLTAVSSMPAKTMADATVSDASRTISPASMTAARPTAAPSAVARLSTPTSVPTATAEPTAISAPAISSATATAAVDATVAPALTELPPVQFTLNVVQWTQTNAGEPVAVVQYNGTLWYVWGPDVDLIERGLDPQYQPVPVNNTARTRRS